MSAIVNLCPLRTADATQLHVKFRHVRCVNWVGDSFQKVKIYVLGGDGKCEFLLVYCGIINELDDLIYIAIVVIRTAYSSSNEWLVQTKIANITEFHFEFARECWMSSLC